jgi:hypothetical protein
LQAENNPQADYQLAMLYLNETDSSNAFATLDNIPVEFDLTQHEQDIHDHYADLFDILWHISSDTLPIDSLQIQSLFDILDNYHTIPGIYARNILANRNLLILTEPIYLPDNLKSMPAWETNEGASAPKDILRVFPNPAGNYFIAYYKIPDEHIEPVMIVTEANGKMIFSLKLRDRENQVVIDMDDYPSGMYAVHLYNNDHLIESAKVIVSK